MTHFLQRTALIALASTAVGALSTAQAQIPRPNFPIRAPDPAPTVPAGPAPAAAAAVSTAGGDAPATTPPPAAVQQTQLAPLAAPAPAPAAPMGVAPPPPSIPRATSTPGAPTPIATYRSVTTRTVTGRVVEVDGSAQTYRVRRGDTVGEVADRLGVTVRRLRADNGLSAREKIRPGQVLKGPRSRAEAYVAEGGDTLFSIARRFGVTADALRDENNLSSDAVRAGQRLRLPDGYRDRGPLVTSTRVRVDGPQALAAPSITPTDSGPDAAPPPRTTAPQPQREATPVYRSVTTRSVAGRVVEVEGRARTYRVRKGDTLTSIARTLDTTVDQLREDNDIKRREKLQPGDQLTGPRTRGRAYVTEGGDTLFGVARRFGVTADALREENDLRAGASLRTGQRIRLPDGARDRGPLTTTTRVLVAPPPAPPEEARPPPRFVPAPRPTPQPLPPPRPQPVPPSYPPLSPAPQPRPVLAPPAPPARVQPPVRSAPAPIPSYTPPTPATAGEAQIAELGRGRFLWPLTGDIISDFGAKPTGQRNDGINIGAVVGSPVRAAAAGDVVYAGDQVPGFGNLVLIKHADGWVTAYGHLSRVQVKMQQKVTQGQEIGLAGATGGVAEPQLHFEIRYAQSPLERAKPIDPKLVLPR